MRWCEPCDSTLCTELTCIEVGLPRRTVTHFVNSLLGGASMGPNCTWYEPAGGAASTPLLPPSPPPLEPPSFGSEVPGASLDDELHAIPVMTSTPATISLRIALDLPRWAALPVRQL